MKKKGFTLLELLITATILAALAVLATSSYKKSMAQTRIQDYKNRTRVVAAAVQQFYAEYPTATIKNTDLEGPYSIGSCSPHLDSWTTSTADQLINCGFLENRVWTDDYVTITVCPNSKEPGVEFKNGCTINSAGMGSVGYPLACMNGKAGKLDEARVSASWAYFCVGSFGEGSGFGS